MRNAALVTDHDIPDSDDMDIRVIDGRENALTLIIDKEGTPQLLTSLGPLTVVDMLLTTAQAVLRGDLGPANLPRGQELTDVLVEKARAAGISEAGIQELLEKTAVEGFNPLDAGTLLEQIIEREGLGA